MTGINIDREYFDDMTETIESDMDRLASIGETIDEIISDVSHIGRIEYLNYDQALKDIVRGNEDEESREVATEIVAGWFDAIQEIEECAEDIRKHLDKAYTIHETALEEAQKHLNRATAAAEQ